jgi:dihydrofolate reductase
MRGNDGVLGIMGSGELIDEYLLMIHPLVLGSGRRLFEPSKHVTELTLIDSTPTTTGIIIAVYQPRR